MIFVFGVLVITFALLAWEKMSLDIVAIPAACNNHTPTWKEMRGAELVAHALAHGLGGHGADGGAVVNRVPDFDVDEFPFFIKVAWPLNVLFVVLASYLMVIFLPL